MLEIGEMNQSVLQDRWPDVLKLLSEGVGEDAYDRWFRDTIALDYEDDKVVIGVPNAIHEFWIESNFGVALATSITTIYGKPYPHKFEVFEVVEEEAIEEGIQAATEESKAGSVRDEVKLSSSSKDESAPSPGLNGDFTFDNFVVGSNCKFAFAAAQAAVDRPGIAFNPLLVYGRTGLGKTHLMQAIGQATAAANPKAKVVYRTSEQFANEFIQGIRRGDTEKLRQRYRKADVLLIDDIQFFAGKDATQEEFFHTFNVLFDGKKQVVLTSDRPPSEIAELEKRLVSRFESGLTTELLAPDGETREAILRSKMQSMDVDLDENLISYLAERIRSNVRRLEGALIRLVSYLSLGVKELDQPMAEELLRDILREEVGKVVSIDQIQRCVAEHYDIRLADMSSRRRPRHIALPRQIAMFLSRDITKAPLKEVGRSFGGRDHGTVIHACKTVGQRIESEEVFRQEIQRIRATIERETA